MIACAFAVICQCSTSAIVATIGIVAESSVVIVGKEGLQGGESAERSMVIGSVETGGPRLAGIAGGERDKSIVKGLGSSESGVGD
jgi:hypothetical protein